MTPSCCGKQHKDSMQRRKRQTEITGYFSKIILPDTQRLHAVCNENSSDPDLSFFPSSEGRLGGGGGWRWRGSGGRGALGSGGSFLNEKTPLSWAESLHEEGEYCVRQRSVHADPDLGGGGWRWRGRGAMGAFGSGGNFLMWKSTFVWVSAKISHLSARKWFHKHAPKHAWPLFLHFQRRSLGRRRGGSRSMRTRKSGGRVFNVLPEQMSQQYRSERCTSRVPGDVACSSS